MKDRGLQIPWLLAVFCVLVTALAVPAVTMSHSGFLEPIDRHKYIFMVEHGPAALGIPPFCYRVGMPFLVGLLPWSTQLGFQIVTSLGLILSAVSIFAIAETLAGDRRAAWVAMGLFFACRFLVFANLIDFWLGDTFTMGLILAACAAALRGRWLLASLCALGAGTCRESALLVGPLIFAWMAPREGWKPAVRVGAILMVLTLIPMMITRVSVPNRAQDSAHVQALPAILFQDPANRMIAPKSLPAKVQDVLSHRLSNLGKDAPLRYIFFPLGVCGLALSLVGPWRRALLWGVPALAMAYGQLLLGTDTERLVAYAAPVFIVVAAVGLSGAQVLSGKFAVACFVPWLGLVMLGALRKGGMSLVAWEVACATVLIVVALFMLRNRPALGHESANELAS